MRRTIFAVLAACLTVAALPIVADATHKPGHQSPGNPGPGGVDITITAKPSVTVFQGATVISGKLRGPNNAFREISLREDLHPFNSVNNVVFGKTDANGDYTFTRRPAKNATYQVSLKNTAVRSPGVLVNVRTRVSLFVSDRTPRVGQVIRFTGRACPTHIGLPVGLQRNGRTVRSTTLLASTRCSVYRRSIRVFSDATFRVVTKGHGDHARGISRSLFVDVHR